MSDQAGVADSAALRARKTWRTLEPLHGMIYFVPEAAEAYAQLGITGRTGFFASPRRAHGGITADVVVSTFFNFDPELVHAAIPAASAVATPAQLVAARFAAVDAALRRLLGEMVLASEEMRRAAVLARAAAEAACRAGTEGRPLAAAHADVGWPIEPHLQLWHAESILREFRGDGHVALLVVHGLSGAKRWSPTRRPATYRPTSCAPRGMVLRGVAGGNGRTAGARLARYERRAPIHRVGSGPAPGDRGRHRRAGGGAICRAGRRVLRRVAGAGEAVEPHAGERTAWLRARRQAVTGGWACLTRYFLGTGERKWQSHRR